MKKYFITFLILIFQFYILIIPAFAIPSSSAILYEGIDVSAWQGNIDFEQVRNSGISIVYIKSSEGFSYVDPYFDQNYTNAKNAGLNIGFYHYVTARTVDEAISQANFFVSTISGKSPDCKLAMDFESFGNLSTGSINQIALTFMQTVQNLSGKDVIIYSDEYNASNTFNYSLATYPLWVAQYGVSEPTVSANWTTWAGWQYTDQGEILGISVYVDRNRFTEEVFLDDRSEIPNNTNNGSDDDSNNSVTYFTIIIPYGATLSGLALQYNTTVATLVQLNNISNPDLIYAGDTLKIPSSESSNSLSTITYIVQSGDTLSQIALTFNTTVTEIAYINNIRNVNLIYTGQTLYIPTQQSGDMSHNLYVVKRGDTLWSISRRFGVSIARIVMLNRIANPNLIYPGNVLRI